MATELRASEALRLFFHQPCNGVLALMGGLSGAVGLWVVGPPGLLAWAAWAAIGVATWPLHEYVTHRWILHAKPLPWAWAVKIQRRLHYDHHVDPRQLDLLFAPLWFTIPAPFLYGAVYLALLPPAAALGMLFGNMATMLFYEWTHFIAHVPYQPRSAYFRRLKTMHTWHHYKNERYWFGVTESIMDRALGTLPEVGAIATSPTVRALHGDEAL